MEPEDTNTPRTALREDSSGEDIPPLRSRSLSRDDFLSQILEEEGIKPSKLHETTIGKIGKSLQLHVLLHKKEDVEHKTKLEEFRKKLGQKIESTWVQYFFLVLLFIDIGILVTEIILETHFSDEHLAEEILRWISIAILLVFLVEQFLLMFSFGRSYFKHPMYVLDFVVVAASLIIEIVLKDILGSFLVLFRLWRVVRITHGIVVAIEEKNRDTKKKLVQHLFYVVTKIEEKKLDEALEVLLNVTEAIAQEEPLPNFSKGEFINRNISLP